MSVDPEFARWLREGVLFAPATDAEIEAVWGNLARSSETTSCLALKAGAEAEARRQLDFLSGPLVIDVHLVDGLRHDLIGRAVRIAGDRQGYEGGATVFVIGVAEAIETEQTRLTVVRRLA